MQPAQRQPDSTEVRSPPGSPIPQQRQSQQYNHLPMSPHQQPGSARSAVALHDFAAALDAAGFRGSDVHRLAARYQGLREDHVLEAIDEEACGAYTNNSSDSSSAEQSPPGSILNPGLRVPPTTVHLPSAAASVPSSSSNIISSTKAAQPKPALGKSTTAADAASAAIAAASAAINARLESFQQAGSSSSSKLYSSMQLRGKSPCSTQAAAAVAASAPTRNSSPPKKPTGSYSAAAARRRSAAVLNPAGSSGSSSSSSRATAGGSILSANDLPNFVQQQKVSKCIARDVSSSRSHSMSDEVHCPANPAAAAALPGSSSLGGSSSSTSSSNVSSSAGWVAVSKDIPHAPEPVAAAAQLNLTEGGDTAAASSSSSGSSTTLGGKNSGSWVVVDQASQKQQQQQHQREREVDRVESEEWDKFPSLTEITELTEELFVTFDARSGIPTTNNTTNTANDTPNTNMCVTNNEMFDDLTSDDTVKGSDSTGGSSGSSKGSASKDTDFSGFSPPGSLRVRAEAAAELAAVEFATQIAVNAAELLALEAQAAAADLLLPRGPVLPAAAAGDVRSSALLSRDVVAEAGSRDNASLDAELGSKRPTRDSDCSSTGSGKPAAAAAAHKSDRKAKATTCQAGFCFPAAAAGSSDSRPPSFAFYGDNRGSSSSGSSSFSGDTTPKKQTLAGVNLKKAGLTLLLLPTLLLLVVMIGTGAGLAGKAVVARQQAAAAAAAAAMDGVLTPLEFEVRVSIPGGSGLNQQRCTEWFGTEEALHEYRRTLAAAYVASLDLRLSEIDSIICGRSIMYSSSSSNASSSSSSSTISSSISGIVDVRDRSTLPKRSMLAAVADQRADKSSTAAAATAASSSSSSTLEIMTTFSLLVPTEISARARLIESVLEQTPKVLVQPLQSLFSIPEDVSNKSLSVRISRPLDSETLGLIGMLADNSIDGSTDNSTGNQDIDSQHSSSGSSGSSSSSATDGSTGSENTEDSSGSSSSSNPEDQLLAKQAIVAGVGEIFGTFVPKAAAATAAAGNSGGSAAPPAGSSTSSSAASEVNTDQRQVTDIIKAPATNNSSNSSSGNATLAANATTATAPAAAAPELQQQQQQQQQTTPGHLAHDIPAADNLGATAAAVTAAAATATAAGRSAAAAAVAAGSSTMSVLWDAAQPCPFTPNRTNAVFDAWGRLWGWSGGKNCAFKWGATMTKT